VGDAAHPAWLHVALQLGVAPSNIPALRAFFEQATSVYSAMATSTRATSRSDGLQRLQELAATATSGMVGAAACAGQEGGRAAREAGCSR
jgi:hypothetical protein